MRYFIFTLTILCSLTAAAADMRGINISTGVVYQTGGDSILGNPGALLGSPKEIDASYATGGGSNQIDGSFSGSSSSVGYGLGYHTNASTAYGGLGFGSARFGIGASAGYNLSASSLGANIGIQYGGSQGFGIGAAVYDITGGFNTYSIGLGFRKPGGLQFELDYVAASTSVDVLGTTVTASTTSIAPGIAFQLGQAVSLMAGYSALTSNLGGGTFRAGFNAWLGSKFALYFLYKASGYDYTGGLRIKL
ncbi:MAG: hypothetical protein AB7P04_02960 [Bacteriovoracia bacterium]